MEKHILQSILLDFEKVHGRPKTRGGRFIVRPIYNRYRDVKKLLPKGSTISVAGNKDTSNGGQLKSPSNSNVTGSSNRHSNGNNSSVHELNSSRLFMDNIIQQGSHDDLAERNYARSKQEWCKYPKLTFSRRLAVVDSRISHALDDYR